jgi:hypothetical protein
MARILYDFTNPVVPLEGSAPPVGAYPVPPGNVLQIDTPTGGTPGADYDNGPLGDLLAQLYYAVSDPLAGLTPGAPIAELYHAGSARPPISPGYGYGGPDATPFGATTVNGPPPRHHLIKSLIANTTAGTGFEQIEGIPLAPHLNRFWFYNISIVTLDITAMILQPYTYRISP